MTKVKIISGSNEWEVERRINEFISDHEVSNINFQVNGESIARCVYSAMIIYEE